MCIRGAIANENGSTLMVVVVFFTLMIIMGVTLISTTAAHVRVQKVQQERKFAFYGAESGIDEVVARLTAQLQVINEGIGGAIDRANEGLGMALSEQAVDYEAYWYWYRRTQLNELLPQRADEITTCPILYNENGTVNQAAAYDYAAAQYEIFFACGFEEWIKNEFVIISPDTPDIQLEALWDAHREANPDSGGVNWGTSLDITTGKESGDIKVGLLINEAEISFSDNELKLPFFSIYNPEGSSRKLLKVDVTIKVPEYMLPIALDQTVLKFDPNILWTKAITTEKDLIVERGGVNIYGNVYALGSENGGVVIGSGSSTELVLKGEAVTSGDVYFNHQNSRFIVEGNIYANNVVLDKRGLALNVGGEMDSYTSYSLAAGGTVGEAYQTGDLVVRHNLELREEATTVDIGGNFTGFSDPPYDNAVENYEETSCIVMDADGSILRISGDAVIGGIAYLSQPSEDGTSIDWFSTGEGVALKDNFMVYANLLENLGAGKNYFDAFANEFVERPRVHGDQLEPIVPPAPLEPTDYIHSGIGLFVPRTYRTKNFQILDYVSYFYQLTQMLGDDGLRAHLESYGYSAVEIDLIKDTLKRDNGRVAIGGEYYGYGVGFGNHEVLPPKIDGLIEPKRNMAEKMFNKQINSYGDLYAADSDSRRLLFGETLSFDFTEDIVNRDDENQELVIVTGDRVDIVGAGEELKAVIVSRGDVTITGDIRLRGTIIAGGNVIINGWATIANDRDFIAKAMAETPGLLEGFTTSAGVWPTYSFKTAPIDREDFRYVSEKEAKLTEKYNSIKDIIRASGWNVVEY